MLLTKKANYIFNLLPSFIKLSSSPSHISVDNHPSTLPWNVRKARLSVIRLTQLKYLVQILSILLFGMLISVKMGVSFSLYNSDIGFSVKTGREKVHLVLCARALALNHIFKSLIDHLIK